MDLGPFGGNRSTLAAWLLVPVLLIVGTHYAGHVYCRSANLDIERRRNELETAPRMGEQLAIAEDVLSRFRGNTSLAAGTADTMGTHINHCAAGAGIEVTSLNIKSTSRTGGGEDLRLSIRGMGGFANVIDFVAAMQTPEDLITVESASFARGTTEGVATYTCELVFVHHGILSSDTGRGASR